MTSPARRQKPSARFAPNAGVAVQHVGSLMGKGRFVNQKLGKNVSRKADLLKSALAGRGKGQSRPLPGSLPVPRKKTFPGKP